MFSNLAADLRGLVGGEVRSYSVLVIEGREEARSRLMEAARRRGANAVLAMRYECNDISDRRTEIFAYGAAVTLMSDARSNDLNGERAAAGT